MSLDAKLLLPHDYILDVTDQIKNAKKRISIMSMVFDDDKSTNLLIEALKEAAGRGVKVELAVDIFSYIELAGFLLPTINRSKKSRRVTNMGKELSKAGVKFTWLGKTRYTIFNGRTHIKWIIVDDVIYSFGGVNLYKKGIECVDYIFKLSSKKLADALVDEYQNLIKSDLGGYASKNRIININKDQIFIDGGIFCNSIIYKQVCKLTKDAKRVRLTSQYCPTGRLSHILKNTENYLYFNLPVNATGINRPLIKTSMLISGNETLYDKSKYLHAKFMLFDMNDGRKIAITGSHNFANTGTVLGTREIALQTENPIIINQLEEFFKANVI